MGTLGRLAAVGVLSWAAVGWADPNDFRLYQLGNPATNPGSNANFLAFAKAFGAALTSSNLMAPATLGHDGFNVAAELALVNIPATDPSAGRPLDGSHVYVPTVAAGFSGRMPLMLPSIHVRKGLPFSFEVGARVTWIDKSQMTAAMGEVRWAVSEGFAAVPDICLRGYGMKLFNTRDFDLQALGVDLGVGKRFAIGGMVTLTPYAGWNVVWVGATSKTVDFDPGRSYASSVSAPDTQLATNAAAFQRVNFGEASHNRFYLGLRFIGGAVQLGVEASYSALGQIDSSPGSGVKISLPPVLAGSTTFGLDF